MQGYKKLLILAIAASLSACGGSSGSNNDRNNTTTPAPTPATPPVSTVALPSVIVGTVSAAGNNSVDVNGYTLPTNNTPVRYAGQTLPANTLAAGWPVKVTTRDNKVEEILLNPSLAGEVTAVTGNSFTVAGATLDYSQASTKLKTGDFALIGTEQQADGSVRVTAVTTLSGGDIPLHYEVEGYLQELSEAGKTFVLNNQSIDFSNAVIEDGPLKNGQWVEVFGRYNGSVFQASEVDVEDFGRADDTEIEGVITWVNEEKTAFELSGRVQFKVNTTTRFDDGKQQDLTIGRYVEVTVKQVNGEPVVTEVEFTKARQPDTEAPAARKFSVRGTAVYQNGAFSINGFNFVIDSTTRFEDRLMAEALDGTAVEIEGVVRDEQFIIREIERADTDNDIDLEGLVSNGSLWGYTATDNSLQAFDGKWADVDCYFDGVNISLCKLDD